MLKTKKNMMLIDYHNPNEYWQGRDPLKGLEQDERIMTGCLHVVLFLLCCALGLLMCALLGSCTTTQYVPVIHHQTDTLERTKVKHDSIYLSDSIYINDFVRDDTVYRTLERWHTKYIERTSYDTVYRAMHDTIPQPYPVTEYVERRRTAAEWLLTILGMLSLAGGAAWVAFRLKRLIS